MLKPRFSYTFTLGPEETEALESIAHESRLSATGAIRRAFLERLSLERAGWQVGDDRMATAIRAIARLEGKELDRASEFIEKL